MRRCSKRNLVLARTNARVQESPPHQLAPGSLVKSVALALKVGAVVSLKSPSPGPGARTLLPANSQPPKVLKSRINVLIAAPFGVQIVNPHHQNAIDTPRTLVSCPKRPRVADVQEPRRGGRKPSSIDVRRKS
jgi:hypothetical protein